MIETSLPTKKSQFKRASHKLLALVLMQLRDKLDMSFTSSKKLFIRKVILSIVKFAAVAGVSFGLFTLVSMLKLTSSLAIVPPEVVTIVMTVVLTLSIISCTVGLSKQLYFAQDNRVLITYPVKNNLIFLSKLIVFYLYELAKSFTFSIPLMVGYGVCNRFSWFYYIWVVITFVFISALPVVIGGVLSIGAKSISTIFKKVPLLKVLSSSIIIVAVIYGVIKLIKIIPVDIDLIGYADIVSGQIRDFLLKFNNIFWLIRCLVFMVTGKLVNMEYHIFTLQTLLYFAIMLLFLVGFLALCFLLSQPLFFKMMSSSFEYEKSLIRSHDNKKHSKIYTFFKKESRMFFRDTGLFLNFLSVYIATPILILLLNQVYSALNTKLTGDFMTYSFNILMVLLPILSSNSIVATLYSREGRAGYIKKTKPIKYALPLTTKLIMNIVLSSISVIASMVIFQSFCHFESLSIVTLTAGLVFIQIAHLFYCASCDILNPQNEQYSTTGETISNPNETKATITAFILSVAVAVFSFLLFSDANISLRSSCVRLLFVGILMLAFCVTTFYLKIKAYYLEK